MSTKYRFTENEVPHFITMTLVEWLDLFSREKYKELVIENIKFCIKEKGLSVHAYVVMTNHLHMIVRSEKDKDLAGIIRDFAKGMAVT
jgi:REP element-mobilizing transposase RayT